MSVTAKARARRPGPRQPHVVQTARAKDRCSTTATSCSGGQGVRAAGASPVGPQVRIDDREVGIAAASGERSRRGEPSAYGEGRRGSHGQ